MLYRPSKEILLAQILIIFVLPVFLLYYDIVDMNARFFLLSFSAVLIYSIILREKWNYADLGLRIDNIKSAMPYYMSTTVVLVSVLFILEYLLNINQSNTSWVVLQRLIFFIPISVFQEFAFSVFLLKRLQVLFERRFLIVFINATLFTFIHIIYDLYPSTAVFLFLSSIISSLIYLYKPNFLLVSVAHSLVNITAVFLGFFV